VKERKNREASKRAGEAKEEGRLRVQERKGHAGRRVRPEKKESPGGSLVRLCEIKTRFTGSFYCGYGVPFVSLWTRATVPFNRFNKYMVAQWPRWEYRASSFFFFFFFFFSTTIFRFLLSFSSYLYASSFKSRFSSRNKRDTLNGLYNFMPLWDRQSSYSLSLSLSLIFY